MIVCKNSESFLSLEISKSTISAVPIIFLPLYKKTETMGNLGNQSHKKSEKKVPSVAKKSEILEKKNVSTVVKPMFDSLQKQAIDRKFESKSAEKKQEVKKKLVANEVKKSSMEKNKSPHEQVRQVILAKNSTQEVPSARYVGRKELSLLQMQARIQQELRVLWSPPRGFSRDIWCEIALQINSLGHVSQADIKKSSGVLLYDLSARNAALKLMLPSWSQGKKFYITFKR
jgi:hypothetical protein